MNYYNDIEPYVADWLENLISANLIPPGHVDRRSISDVEPSDLAGYTQCHFFCGIAGWPRALELAGWPASRPVWTGSPPCQPFSAAGLQRGLNDDRHLWPHYFRLIRACKPPTVFGEQVAAAIGKGWLDVVLSDLEAEGYACGSFVLPAWSVGANHERERIAFVADAEWNQQPREESCGRQAGRMGRLIEPFPWDADSLAALPFFRALDDGIPRRVGATDAARNAIVPPLMAEFVAAYMDTTLPGREAG